MQRSCAYSALTGFRGGEAPSFPSLARQSYPTASGLGPILVIVLGVVYWAVGSQHIFFSSGWDVELFYLSDRHPAALRASGP
jgi:hypothetical protein